MNETFFGQLGEMDVTRLGCPKAVNIPRMMSNVTEMMHYRHNPHNRLSSFIIPYPVTTVQVQFFFTIIENHIIFRYIEKLAI